MDFQILVQSANVENDTTELIKFIKESRIAGLNISRKEVLPIKGDLGSDTVQIITAVLSAPIVTTLVQEFIDILKSYINSKRDSIIKITNGEKTIEISYKNLNDKEIVDQFSKILDSTK